MGLDSKDIPAGAEGDWNERAWKLGDSALEDCTLRS